MNGGIDPRDASIASNSHACEKELDPKEDMVTRRILGAHRHTDPKMPPIDD